MASSRPHAAMYEQLLLFPERAENLADSRFGSYRVSLDHWRSLASTFRDAFEAVHRRGSARVLLVHGGQGHGKSLFVQTLAKDFDKSRQAIAVDLGNLWHALAGGTPPDIQTIQKATSDTSLRRVDPRTGWLDKERDFSCGDKHEIRILLFDDAHKDPFVREWAGLTQPDYARLKAENRRDGAIGSVAERLVEDCRGDFARSVFVLLSNDAKFLDELDIQIARSHNGLALRVNLPLPEPAVKEEIVRTNTNLLNPRSYWFCLDQGGPDEKLGAYKTLQGDRGFIDVYQAIDRALAAQGGAKRTGRPANKNLLTLVTLGTPPSEVTSFFDDHDMSSDEASPGEHVAVWVFRNRWASLLKLGALTEQSRRASLVESEFELRWVALDMAATWTVCHAADSDGVAQHVADLLTHAPRIGAKKDVKAQRKGAIEELNANLHGLNADPRVLAFAESFRNLGQQRSRVYEPAISSLIGRSLSVGLRVRGALKPDLILGEYDPCAVTSATSPDIKGIEAAIKRGCHVIELTAHLQDDMKGLDDYLSDKVRVYAELLESV